MANARHTMESGEWYTPSKYVEAARQVMGGIDLDPASEAEANEIVKAEYFYSKDESGLDDLNPWHGRVFLNPPGGMVRLFWDRLMYYWGSREIEQAIWIGYSLEQLQTLQAATRWPLEFSICIPERRIAFVESEKRRRQREARLVAAGMKPRPAGSPSHGNYVTYLGRETRQFGIVFSAFGRVLLRPA